MIVAILSFSTVSLLPFKTYSPNPASVVCERERESSFRTHFRLESVLRVDVNGIPCQSCQFECTTQVAVDGSDGSNPSKIDRCRSKSF